MEPFKNQRRKKGRVQVIQKTLNLKNGARAISHRVSIRLKGHHVIWHRPDLPDLSQANGHILFSPAAGLAGKTYNAFLSQLAEMAKVNIFTYDIRGTGDSSLPVAPAYRRGKTHIGECLGDDLAELFWMLRDYLQTHEPSLRSLPWIFAGHSLGAWLSIYAAVYAHVRRLLLIDPPIFSTLAGARWALACSLNRRDKHPLSILTRRRKRTFSGLEQAIWLFSKLEFFKGWPRERLRDYVQSNYRSDEFGLSLRHNPLWEADIVESQPASSALALLGLPKAARHNCKTGVVFGAESPFRSTQSDLLLMAAFQNPILESVPHAGHMVIFQNEQKTLQIITEKILTSAFLSLDPLLDLKNRSAS